MTVAIEQAAQNALASFLATRLGTGVTVAKQWPAPDRTLPALAATVIQAGETEWLYCQPEAISSTAGSTSGTRLYRWLVLEVTQPLQIDCWATTPGARSNLRARVAAALQAGNMTERWPVPGGGLQLALLVADGWQGVADFTFKSFSNLDTPDSAQQSEYRAIAQGEARVAFYIDAETPRLARIILQQTIDGATRTDTAED